MISRLIQQESDFLRACTRLASPLPDAPACNLSCLPLPFSLNNIPPWTSHLKAQQSMLIPLQINRWPIAKLGCKLLAGCYKAQRVLAMPSTIALHGSEGAMYCQDSLSCTNPKNTLSRNLMACKLSALPLATPQDLKQSRHPDEVCLRGR